MTRFPVHALSFLVSPITGSELSSETDERFIENGAVIDNEGNRFAIENGILRLLVPDQLLAIENEERSARDREATVYDARLYARHYREVLPFMAMIDPKKEDVALELACGTGRITKELAPAVGSFIATDFSYASLREASKAVQGENVAFVEADSTAFPGKNNSFSLIVSAQFIEHIPTPERRTAFAERLSCLLRKEGRTLHSLYHQDVRRSSAHLPNEGTHRNGVYYHYYTRKDCTDLFDKHFKKISIGFLDIVLPGVLKITQDERILGAISRISARTPLSSLAHLVVVEASKPTT